MKVIIVFALLGIATGCTHDQKTTTEPIEENVLVTPLEISPVWVNGTNDALLKLIQSKIEYPKEQCLAGSCVLQFTVDTFGIVREPQMKRSISKKIDDQLFAEIVKYKFESGTMMNKKTNFLMNFPFRIILE